MFYRHKETQCNLTHCISNLFRHQAKFQTTQHLLEYLYWNWDGEVFAPCSSLGLHRKLLELQKISSKPTNDILQAFSSSFLLHASNKTGYISSYNRRNN